MNKLFSELTSKRLMVIGFFLIFLGNLFKYKILEVDLHALVANIGALLLVVGVMQWYFDEEGRRLIIDDIKGTLENCFNEQASSLIKKDGVFAGGVVGFLANSKDLHGDEFCNQLREVDRFVIGVHYSDGFLTRFKELIESRLKLGKEVALHRVRLNGAAQNYLQHWHSGTDVLSNLKKQDGVIDKISQSSAIEITDSDVVQKYTFIYTEKFIWIIFSTSSIGYVSSMPALRVQAGSPMYNFFKNDIKNMGVAV